MKNKQICIIGGLGFLGRNLSEMLDETNQITVVDIGERPEYLSNHIKYVSVINNNIELFIKKKFDYIFFLAGNASVGSSVSNPVADLKKNTMDLLNILEILKNKKSKFIFASSAACYGEMKNPVTANKIEPISPYGISKLFSEKYLKYYHKHYGMHILICRFFSLFGEYNQKQVIYDTTIRLLKHPEKLTIYNPNSQRDFVYIREAIKAMLFLCNKDRFGAEVYDIGRGKNLSIYKLTVAIGRILNIFPTIKKIDKEFTGDPNVQIADINKLKKLGFDFSTSTLDNLRKTTNWIRGISK